MTYSDKFAGGPGQAGSAIWGGADLPPTRPRGRDAESIADLDVVHADILRFFPDLVTDLGGDPKRLAREVGIDPSSLQSGATIGYRLIVNLLQHAAVQLRQPDFGMRLAILQGGGQIFGPMSAVMRNSNTLGDALAYAKEHIYAHSLAARVSLERHDAGRQVFVGHDILLDGLPNKCQAIEQILLFGHLNAVAVTGGRARARKVYFRHQPLSPLSTYRRYFGCDVRFDQQVDGVVFSEQDLLCPVVDPDARAYERATLLIDTAFTPMSPPMHAQVRGVIMRLVGTPDCCNERVAAELNLHPRTLYRRLKAEGKSFQEIKDEVRRDVALYYLHQTRLDLTDIAGKLGYAEHSVFTRRCIRWFSAAPSELRSQARPEGGPPPPGAVFCQYPSSREPRGSDTLALGKS